MNIKKMCALTVLALVCLLYGTASNASAQCANGSCATASGFAPVRNTANFVQTHRPFRSAVFGQRWIARRQAPAGMVYIDQTQTVTTSQKVTVQPNVQIAPAAVSNCPNGVCQPPTVIYRRR